MEHSVCIYEDIFIECDAIYLGRSVVKFQRNVMIL